MRRNATKRATLKLVSWNVNSYTPRAPYVEALFAHEQIDVLFVCETKQQRWPSGSVKPLEFDGSIIAMSAHAPTSSATPASPPALCHPYPSFHCASFLGYSSHPAPHKRKRGRC